MPNYIILIKHIFYFMESTSISDVIATHRRGLHNFRYSVLNWYSYLLFLSGGFCFHDWLCVCFLQKIRVIFVFQKSLLKVWPRQANWASSRTFGTSSSARNLRCHLQFYKHLLLYYSKTGVKQCLFVTYNVQAPRKKSRIFPLITLHTGWVKQDWKCLIIITHIVPRSLQVTLLLYLPLRRLSACR